MTSYSKLIDGLSACIWDCSEWRKTMTAQLTATALALQLRGYRLTTAEILYGVPDYPSILQTYTWQDLDLAPRYPRLHHFLDFWRTTLEGPLVQVRVASLRIVSAGELRAVGTEFRLH